MRRASALWEVFVLGFEEAMERCRKRRLSAEEAGEVPGMSGRHFRRLLVRCEEEGAEGLRERRLGRPSPRRAPAAEPSRMQILYQERCRDFTVKPFHEQPVRRHNDKLSYTVTRLSLRGAGLVAKARRRGGIHRKRERRPLPGMLYFQDGSTHRRIGALDRDLDLVVTLHDATGAITSAILVEEEGTMSSFLGLSETIGECREGPVAGLLHRPRLALLPYAQGLRQARQVEADPGRAGALAARHHPHPGLFARGARPHGARVRHLQSRLPPELRLFEIATLEAANRSAIAAITSAPRCGCPNIPTAGSPSSTGRAASPASPPTASRFDASKAA